MKNAYLDQLVDSKVIEGYRYIDMDEEGNEGVKSSFRNTQSLTIFLNGEKSIKIDCFCSGSSENTNLIITS